MNRDTLKVRPLTDEEPLDRVREALVPKRFDRDAVAVLEGRVPSPAFATWAQKNRRAPTTKKRRRKLADASRRRNRRG